MENPSNITENSTVRIYKFGNCYLDTIERKVFKEGKLLNISSKAFDVLQFLAERSGEVLTKDEILEHVWAGSFVEEGNLAVYISRLRKVLGATKSEPFIETVSGSGYRFVSRVYQIDEEVWQFHLLNTPKSNNETSESESYFDSIAVLPLKNENGDEEIDYLADGLTESIINNLSYIPNLRVLARNTIFRFKNKEIDIQDVGTKLGVSAILTGRIRVIQDNLIIGIELTKVADRRQLWGTQFNEPFEDIFKIQENITQAVLDNLRSKIGLATKKSAASKITENSESYRLYLKGKYLFNKKSIQDINKAIDCFQQSISFDPTNAHSYIELANCYRLLYSFNQISYKEARNQILTSLEKATQLNKLISELYVFKAILEMSFGFNIKETEKNLKKALILNPNSVNAHYRYSKLLIYCSQFSEALLHMKEYLRLDPFSLESNKNVAGLFYFMEQFQNAVIKLEECLELEPDDFQTHLLLGISLTELGKYEEALEAFQKSLDLQYHMETLSMISYAYARRGNESAARKILSQLEENSKKIDVAPNYLGIIYATLGEVDKAFILINKAIEEHDTDIISLKCDPRWKSLKNDSRFNQMLSKIGLPIN